MVIMAMSGSGSGHIEGFKKRVGNVIAWGIEGKSHNWLPHTAVNVAEGGLPAWLKYS